MPTVPPLRSLPPDAAVRMATREAERLGMRFETQLTGPPGYPVEVSHLMRGDTEVAEGGGRGSGPAGVAGGHFEALERYFMSARVNRHAAAGAASMKKATDVARQPGLAADLVIQRWAADFPGAMAACAVYGNPADSVWYPVFLGDPHYYLEPLPGDSAEPYHSMIRYSSSLGIAAGSTAQEAHLHGLCELIEHDALSHALLRWFIARTPRADVVDVPGPVKPLRDLAAEAVGSQVLLFDVTTDIGVPAYLAVPGERGAGAGPVGTGASPIGEHAAARALGELIQQAVLPGADRAREAGERLAAWPALRDCLTLPASLLSSRNARQVSLRGTVGEVSTVESGLATVTGLLSRRGIHPYTCELAPPGSLISVISTIAPGLERFSLVRMGLPVIPTGRGWDIWAHARATPAVQ